MKDFNGKREQEQGSYILGKKADRLLQGHFPLGVGWGLSGG